MKSPNILYLAMVLLNGATAKPLTLGYQSVKPFYFNPRPYPEVIVSPGTPWPDRAPEVPTTEIPRVTQTTTTDGSIDERFKPTVKPVEKPLRPSFLPNPVPYPQPVEVATDIPSPKPTSKPIASTIPPAGTTEISDRFMMNGDSTTNKPAPGQSLEYVPTKPFYYPNDKPYPEPFIPPGTPWPAGSTIPPDESIIDSVTRTTSVPTIFGSGPSSTGTTIPPDESIIDSVTRTTSVPTIFGDSSPNTGTRPTQSTIPPDESIIDSVTRTTSLPDRFGSGSPNTIGSTFYPYDKPYPPPQNVNHWHFIPFIQSTGFSRPHENEVYTTVGQIDMRKPGNQLPTFFGGKPYPEPFIPPGTPWPTRSTFIDTIGTTNLIPNRYKSTTRNYPPNPSLEYKPLQPTFFGNRPYPEPFIPPGTPWPAVSTSDESITRFTRTSNIPDRFKATSPTTKYYTSRPITTPETVSDRIKPAAQPANSVFLSNPKPTAQSPSNSQKPSGGNVELSAFTSGPSSTVEQPNNQLFTSQVSTPGLEPLPLGNKPSSSVAPTVSTQLFTNAISQLGDRFSGDKSSTPHDFDADIIIFPDD